MGKLDENREQVRNKLSGTGDKHGSLGTFEQHGIDERCFTPAVMLLVKIMPKFLGTTTVEIPLEQVLSLVRLI